MVIRKPKTKPKVRRILYTENRTNKRDKNITHNKKRQKNLLLKTKKLKDSLLYLKKYKQ